MSEEIVYANLKIQDPDKKEETQKSDKCGGKVSADASHSQQKNSLDSDSSMPSAVHWNGGLRRHLLYNFGNRNDKIESIAKGQGRTSGKCFPTAEAQSQQLQENQEPFCHAAKHSHPAVPRAV